MGIRLLVADCDPILLAGIGTYTSGTDIALIGSASSAQETILMIAKHAPDAVLLSVRLADTDGIAVLEEIRRSYPELPVVMLAVYDHMPRMARARNAVILAHNYQRPEIQDVADFVGDSLGLSRQAAASDAEIILFCGVDFMAETAAILAPQKLVLLPEGRACCPMAQMVDVEGLVELKAAHPHAWVVSYVNTSAAVKALSDVCCTSANAVQVVASIPEDKEIIFTPDRNLGAWTQKQTGRPMILWEGFCPTHELILLADVEVARRRYPEAKVVVHPECTPEVSMAADAVESTSGMIRFCRDDPAAEFIIGTEAGMIHRLRMDVPNKNFHLLTSSAVCPNMKLTTLTNALQALRRESPVVTVPEEIRLKALAAVERMVSIGR